MIEPRLFFPFDPEKMTEALAYFGERGVRGLTMLKALKLLYLADRDHLVKYSRPIVGGRYVLLQLGPVGLETYDIVSEAVAGVELESPLGKLFADAINIKRNPNYDNPLLTARREARRDVFSETDLESLDSVINEYGNMTARERSLNLFTTITRPVKSQRPRVGVATSFTTGSLLKRGHRKQLPPFDWHS